MTSTWPSSFSIFAISSYSASMSNSGTITKGAYCNLAELLSCVFSVLKAWPSTIRTFLMSFFWVNVLFLALFRGYWVVKDLLIGDYITFSNDYYSFWEIDPINLESPWGASSDLDDEEDDSYEDLERKVLASRGLFAIKAVSNLFALVIFSFLSS